jgi:predicted enzyme related to lactoylglutathione lyase
MSLTIRTVTIDCADPGTLAAWWAEALGWTVTYESDDEWIIEPETAGPSPLLFIKVPDQKQAKNRVHLDIDSDDQAVEVARLEGMGATRIDIGQKDVSWVVMADPEGNEFCILRPHQ